MYAWATLDAYFSASCLVLNCIILRPALGGSITTFQVTELYSLQGFFDWCQVAILSAFAGISRPVREFEVYLLTGTNCQTTQIAKNESSW